MCVCVCVCVCVVCVCLYEFVIMILCVNECIFYVCEFVYDGGGKRKEKKRDRRIERVCEEPMSRRGRLKMVNLLFAVR